MTEKIRQDDNDKIVSNFLWELYINSFLNHIICKYVEFMTT